jgi:hypothetical protein
MGDRVRECIEVCLDCHRVCLETATYLSSSAERVGAEDLRLLFTTAEVCHAGASLLRGPADRTGSAYAMCAELCQRAARYCDAFGDDPRMRSCANACRRCADACHALAAAAAVA